jgi:hypothetical protein
MVFLADRVEAERLLLRAKSVDLPLSVIDMYTRHLPAFLFSLTIWMLGSVR